MVALLNNDISLTGSRYVRPERIDHPVGSQLTFGLGRRINYLLVAGALVFALVLTVRVAQGSATESLPEESSEAASDDSSSSSYVVQPGDTLWGLATEIAPNEDPRPVVDQLIELNGSAAISVGQELTLPAGVHP